MKLNLVHNEYKMVSSHIFILFIVLLFMVNSISGAILCKLDDVKCTTRAANKHLMFISGIQNAVDTSDPLSRDLIRGYLPSVKYYFYNATFKGLKNCIVTKFEIDSENLIFRHELECPRIDVYADYVLKGKVGEFSVKGEGPAHIICADYRLKFECEYEKYIGKDNKEHVHIKNYLLEVVPEGNVVLDFKNLSAGNKEQTEALHNFLNKNWKSMDRELRAPALNSFMDLFIDNINNFLETVSIEELLADPSHNL